MEHEIGTTAATKALKDDGYEFEFALIPEPTNLEVHVISPGAFVLEIKVMGREVHDGVRNVILYPQPWGVPSGSDVGADAIEKIVLIYNALRYLERDVIMRWKHKLLGGGGYPRGPDLQGVGSFFNLNIALIEGGTYISSVPGYAKISANCYYPPWLSFEDVKNLILKTLDSLASYDSWLARNPPKVSFSMLWPPYETEINNPYCEILALSIKEATQKEVVYSGFKAVCDVSFLQPFGIKGVCFGPGDLTMGSHGPNEYVPIHQIIDAAKSIATFLIRTCNNK
jgi:acetylornithine deacetylase